MCRAISVAYGATRKCSTTPRVDVSMPETARSALEHESASAKAVGDGLGAVVHDEDSERGDGERSSARTSRSFDAPNGDI